MHISLPAGTYIIAVSGGVDSVVLLHMLQSNPAVKLVVAHFDHGIREDSVENADFVKVLAELYGLPFEARREELGPRASEGLSRSRRYLFLRDMMRKHKAVAILTAHHQDDRIETAAINVLRGTRRRGFVSLKSTASLMRPLLSLTKDDIRDYATQHHLEYFEDSTNASMDYLRNRVRARLYGRLSTDLREKLVTLLNTIESDNQQIDGEVGWLMAGRTDRFPRADFVEIDAAVLFELVAEWLRKNDATFDKNTIVRICNGVRSLQTGAKIDIDKFYYCQLTRTEVVLMRR